MNWEDRDQTIEVSAAQQVQVQSNLMGPEGPAGPTGPQGPQGLIGPAGPAGSIEISDTPPEDTSVLWADTTTDGVAGPGGGSLQTVDSGEDYRLIVFANGDVRGVPINAQAPATPTGLVATPTVRRVNVSWDSQVDAVSYNLYRDGNLVANVSTPSYRDTDVVLSQAYAYTVRAISSYGLYSAATAPVNALVDPALNVTPSVDIRVFPDVFADNTTAMVRVNAVDLDAQELALALNVDVGTLTPSPDPSLWYLEAV